MVNWIFTVKPFRKEAANLRDHDEFTHLARAYVHTVYRVAYGYLRSTADAEDVTQNVLLKLYRSEKAFESDDHVKYWLIRVTVNECKKQFLSPWRHHEQSIEELAQEWTFDTPEHSELFYEVMSLPQKYRVVLLLYYYEDYSTPEIGDILGISPATVRTRLARGREQLKHILTEQEEFDERPSTLPGNL